MLMSTALPPGASSSADTWRTMRRNGPFAGKATCVFAFQVPREGVYCLPHTPSTPLHAHTYICELWAFL